MYKILLYARIKILVFPKILKKKKKKEEKKASLRSVCREQDRLDFILEVITL